jgi:hypothetical protein
MVSSPTRWMAKPPLAPGPLPPMRRRAASLKKLRPTEAPSLFGLWTAKPAPLPAAPAGDRLALAGRDGRLYVLGIEDRSLDISFELDGARDSLIAAAFSADGRLVAGATDSGVARVWDLVDGDPASLPLYSHQYCTAIAFRQDRDQLLVPGATVRV